MKRLKKFILLCTHIPFLGKYINKPIVLHRRFLDLIHEVNVLRHELNTLKSRTEKSDISDYNNIVKSVPVGFRNFHNQIAELSLKITVLENQLKLANLKKATEDTLHT